MEANKNPTGKSEAVINFSKCLEFAVKYGQITHEQADQAMADFLDYEFRTEFDRHRDAVLAVEDQVIDTVNHAVLEGWVSREQADEAIRCYHLGLYSKNGVDEVA